MTETKLQRTLWRLRLLVNSLPAPLNAAFGLIASLRQVSSCYTNLSCLVLCQVDSLSTCKICWLCSLTHPGAVACWQATALNLNSSPSALQTSLNQ